MARGIRGVVVILLIGITNANRFSIDRTDYFKCIDNNLLNKNPRYKSNPGYTAAQIQCIDWSGGTPVFVRGTYGMFGYFEGAINANDKTARYKWFESSNPNTTDMGNATVSYSSFSNHLSISGVKSSTVTGIRGKWNATTCVNHTAFVTNEDKMRDCLWSPVTNQTLVKAALNKNKSSLDLSKFASASGSNDWCFNNLTAGTYRYNYSEEECRSLPCSTAGTWEEGTYQKVKNNFGNALDISLTDSFAYFGSWAAETGPAKGQSGPDLYVALFDDNSTKAALTLRGFYCLWNYSTLVRTDCFFEYYRFEQGPAYCAGVCRRKDEQVCCSRRLSDPSKEWSIDFGKAVSVSSIELWTTAWDGSRILPVTSQRDLQGLTVRTGYNASINQQCAVPFFTDDSILNLQPKMERMAPGSFGFGVGVECEVHGRYLSVSAPQLGSSDALVGTRGTFAEVCLLPRVTGSSRNFGLWFSQDNLTSVISVEFTHSQIQNAQYNASNGTLELQGVQIALYAGGDCSVSGECTGRFVSRLSRSGRVNAQATAWVANVTLPGGLLPGTYWLKFYSSDFYAVAKSFEHPRRAAVHVTMVKKALPGQLRVVLTWAAEPLDLDLHIMTGEPPKVVSNLGWQTSVLADENHLYWKLPQLAWGGVTLDSDHQHGFGPETVTFDNTSNAALKYSIVVHIYNSSQPEVFSFDRSTVHVNIFDSDGLVYSATPGRGVSQAMAWYVGFIRVSSVFGNFSFTSMDSAISALDGSVARFSLGLTHSQISAGDYSYSPLVDQFYTIDTAYFASDACDVAHDVCTGSPVWLDKRGQAADDGNSWSATLVRPDSSESGGWLRFTSELFYTQLLLWDGSDPVVRPVSMIARACSGCLRVVLTWGNAPHDLDLHVMDVSPPTSVTRYGWDNVADAHHLYWNNRGPLWKGVSLDVDDEMKYGPETVTFEETTDLYRNYFIAVHVYNSITDETFGTNAGDVKVSIYDSTSLVFSATGLEASIGNKMYWQLGYVTKKVGPGGSGFSWSFTPGVTAPKTVAVTFADSQIMPSELTAWNFGDLDKINVALYSGGACNEYGVCTGSYMEALSPSWVGEPSNGQWLLNEEIPDDLVGGTTYWLLFTSDYYYTSAVQFTLVNGVAQAPTVTMVRKVCPQCLRVVLTWGATPDDLDLHVIDKEPPAITSGEGWTPSEVPYADHVFWEVKDTVKWNGVKLDVDDTYQFGPETVSFGPSTNADTDYYIAIHLYSFEANDPFGTDANNVAVRVYDGNGLVTVAKGGHAGISEKVYWTVGRARRSAGKGWTWTSQTPSVQLALSDSQVSVDSLSNSNFGKLAAISVALYSSWTCSDGTCSGTKVAEEGDTSGGYVMNQYWRVSIDLPTAQQNVPYWLVLYSDSYFQKVLPFRLPMSGSLSTTMVQKPPTGGLRVVLTWGAIPLDLDLHISTVVPDPYSLVSDGWTGIADYEQVYWVSGQRGPKFGGVVLDSDAWAGFGPETATFSSATRDDDYYILVHAYSSPDTPPIPFGSDYGNVSIDIYDHSNLVQHIGLSGSNVQTKSGWLVGKVTKASGAYTVSDANQMLYTANVVHLSLTDSQISSTDLSASKLGHLKEISVALYANWYCIDSSTCWGDWLDDLGNTTGGVVGSGAWQVTIGLPDEVMASETYWLVLSSSAYFLKALQFSLAQSNPLIASMVRKPDAGGLRVVLTWGAQPTDLDLHVSTVAPTGVLSSGFTGIPDDQHVWWPGVATTTKFGGVTLDVDDTSSYGPETVTFAAATANFDYLLLVHAYAAQFGADYGEVSVDIYSDADLLAHNVLTSQAQTKSGWLVGKVTKSADGFSFSSAITTLYTGRFVSLALSDSQVAGDTLADNHDNLLDIHYRVLKSPCTNDPCSGDDILVTSTILPTGKVVNNAWSVDINLPSTVQDSTAYALVLSSSVYFDNSITFTLPLSGPLVATMVQKPDAGALRVVLRWGASPEDLDLHITRVTPDPNGLVSYGWTGLDLADHLFYDQAQASWGVTLDVDDTSSYGPETVTFAADTVADDYYILVHCYALPDGSVSQFGADYGEVSVDIYSDTALVQSNVLTSQAQTKSGWLVGKVTKSGTGFVFSDSDTILYSANVLVLALSDSQLDGSALSSDHGDLGSVSVGLYSSMDCPTIGSPCSGTKLTDLGDTSSGLVANSAWSATFILPTEVQPGIDYWLMLSSSAYFQNVVQFRVPAGTLSATLVQKPCQGCFRVVLTWGATPHDLDLHIATVSPSAVTANSWTGITINQHVWYGGKGPKFNGVKLDVDNQGGYGPETVTFEADTDNGDYYLLVQAYNAQFGAGNYEAVKVEVYDDTQLVAQKTLSNAAVGKAGWQVGVVSKGGSAFLFSDTDEQLYATA